jgi:hypothetical protein
MIVERGSEAIVVDVRLASTLERIRGASQNAVRSALSILMKRM